MSRHWTKTDLSGNATRNRSRRLLEDAALSAVLWSIPIWALIPLWLIDSLTERLPEGILLISLLLNAPGILVLGFPAYGEPIVLMVGIGSVSGVFWYTVAFALVWFVNKDGRRRTRSGER